MKIKYITNARIPTEKAHGFQIATMCHELALAGAGVELIVPTRKNDIREDVFSFYNIQKNFDVKYIKNLDFLALGILKKISFFLQRTFFLVKLFFLKIDAGAFVYTRDPEVAWLFSHKNNKTIYEAHNWPNTKSRFFKFLLRNVDCIICNSNGTADKFRENHFKKISVLPNGVDLHEFNIVGDKNDWKSELGLPKDKKIIMYVGSLYQWKGIGVILETAELFCSRTEIEFIIVGGNGKDEVGYRNVIQRKGIHNVMFYGLQKREIIPKFIKSADILLLPNIPMTKESVSFTSPIKMFEYMSSGNPIVASDLPSIREVLHDRNAILVKSNDALSLKHAIERLLSDKNLSKNLAKHAFIDVQEYTWQKRAESLINIMHDLDIGVNPKYDIQDS